MSKVNPVNKVEGNIFYLHLKYKKAKTNTITIKRLRTNKNKQEVLNKIVNDMESPEGLILQDKVYKKEDYSFKLY